MDKDIRLFSDLKLDRNAPTDMIWKHPEGKRVLEEFNLVPSPSLSVSTTH